MAGWSVERVKVMPYHKVTMGKILWYFTLVPHSPSDAYLLFAFELFMMEPVFFMWLL